MDEKMSNKQISGYFTVEAALVMPVVFTCYFAVIVLLCYTYERCILEQNACRLSVWREYVEGYVNLYPDSGDEFSGEEISRYLLDSLNKEEGQRYLLGWDIRAGLTMRGEKMTADRSFMYSQFGEWKHSFSVTSYCLEPADYIRTVNLLKNTIMGEEE